MSQAGIIDFEAAIPQMPTSFDTDSGTAVPVANVLEILGNTVANVTNAEPVFTLGSGNTVTIEVQVGAAITGAPLDKNDAGLVSFDDTQFTVDANGFVQLIGGSMAIDSFITDLNSPVIPDGSGQVTVTGTHIFSDGAVAYTLTLDVDATANTFLYGQGDNVAMAELGPLTNGQLIIGSTGGTPIAGSLTSTDGSVTISTGAGTIDLAVAAGDDAILTLTGDSGGAISPTLGNINILGGPGVTVTGAGSTLTVNSVVYTDQAGSTSVVSDSGSFSTGAITLTLPASPANGERCEFIASTSDQLVVAAAGTQVIHMGNDSTSAGGSCTNSAQGDALQLIFQSSTNDWFALSAVGVWTLT